MNIAQTILRYETMQATAEAMVKANHPSVTFYEGEFLRNVLWDSDIRPEFEGGDFVRFSGMTYTTVFGGSHEPFGFTIPVDVFTKVVEARLTAVDA